MNIVAIIFNLIKQNKIIKTTTGKCLIPGHFLLEQHSTLLRR